MYDCFVTITAAA